MTEHVDVVIVGAGISGISAAWHLQQRCPSKSFVVLERRENLGGTWDLFKYPGIRSDSDMFTLGFRFKPWTDPKAIADGASIMRYLTETVDECGIDKHIRYRHRVLGVDWSSADNRWTVRAEVDGEQEDITCSFLFACTGYYNYDEGYSPEFPGAADFRGTIVHPQHWPENLDYAGKRIVVIGSGATAVTLIPALASSGAGHVTMLQRSPTYISALPAVDPLAARVNKLLPAKPGYVVNRWKSIVFQSAQYRIARRFPDFMRKQLMTMAQRRLPEGYDVQRHFGPNYKVWDERLCLAPNGDLFRAIRKGRADVVTDTIDRFTETGIKLSSGAELAADIIVTATGLNLQLFGGADIRMDGHPLDLTTTMAYKGMMLSGVPNMAFTVGYTNASWTLKADLVSEFVCRVLNFMDSRGYDHVVPKHPDSSIDERPLLDFTPGYVLRALDRLPKAGSRSPWRLKQNYLLDLRLIRHGKVDDEALDFSKSRAAAGV
ncbi:flavin-containing monooxygenase [Candidatus Mycolicibacterium alkanivorans]|uniref:NAD(P)/FAD-dependent oxidoreductase n=1 Tax=Candidatus Mycolicibacterium alkanivorans TaxID=2954114 RepID=A0ABS9YST4_9MYCO|nr:NAD(P)/FAD-dependent oxidoreductase [Candidatus Mycolicibacterium alkanivorans]MCI4674207.1 NAD(P)/FAD-dependent oxidoreductase [Candidatus Mycolicibacterium alkanivorans]